MKNNREILGYGPRMALDGKRTRIGRDMQMGFTDAMLENPDAEDDNEEAIQTMIGLIAKLKNDNPDGYAKVLDAVAAMERENNQSLASDKALFAADRAQSGFASRYGNRIRIDNLGIR